MANEKYTDLPIVTSPSLSDITCIVHPGLISGNSSQITLGNIFSLITMQIPYNNNPNILLANGSPINITDLNSLIAMNLDPGSQKFYTDYTLEATTGGYTSHLINQNIISSLTVSSAQLDRTNINNTSNSYIWTLPVTDTFNNGSTLNVTQVGAGGSIELIFPTGVYLNGVQNTSITINTIYENLTVRKIGAQQYMTVFYSLPSSMQNIYDNSGSTVNVNLNSNGLSFTETLIGISPLLFFNSTKGNYLNFGSAGRNIGVQNFGNFFISMNLDYDATANQYLYNSSSSATAVILNNGFGSLSYSISGIASNPATILNALTWDIAGNIYAQNGSFNLGTGSTNSSAILQINSTTQGVLLPNQTNTEVNSIVSPATSLIVYNTTYDNFNYYNSLGELQSILRQNQIIETDGSVTVDYLSDGRVSLSAAGGSVGGTQVQGSFTTHDITGTMFVIAGRDLYVSISHPGSPFNVINSIGTNVTLFANSSGYAPIIQNNTTAGRWGMTRYDLSMNFQTSGSADYIFTIFTNSGATTYSQEYTFNFSPGSEFVFSFASPVVYLAPGDYVYLSVTQASGTSVFGIAQFSGSWVDTSIAGIPNTNALTQGSSNLYLSQNAGSTYQNIASPLVVGNLVQANTTGGELIDSGIPTSSVFNWVLVTGTAQTMAMNTGYIVKSGSLVTFTLPSTASSIGSMEIAGTGSANWKIVYGTGQSIEFNGISSTTSTGDVESNTANDSARLVYAGDGSGIFNIELSNGMELILN